MSDGKESYEKYQVYIEKEKTRELLNEAMLAPPARQNWRFIILLCLGALVMGGVFAARTKRFREVMTKIEQDIERKRTGKVAKKAQQNASATAKDPDKAIENAEKVWEKELAGKAGQDLDVGAEIKSREALGSQLEKISENPGLGIQGARALSSTGTAKTEESLLPNLARPDTVGIATGEVEPQVDAFQISVKPHTENYKELKALPAHYAREKEEFPDFR